MPMQKIHLRSVKKKQTKAATTTITTIIFFLTILGNSKSRNSNNHYIHHLFVSSFRSAVTPPIHRGIVAGWTHPPPFRRKYHHHRNHNFKFFQRPSSAESARTAPTTTTTTKVSSSSSSATATTSAVATTTTTTMTTLSPNLLEDLRSHANSYAAAHGLQVETRTPPTTKDDNKNDNKSYYQCAPISLLPNAYPAIAFHQAQLLATPFNELVDRISDDSEFFQQTLGGDVSNADPYTGKLLELYNNIYDIGKTTKGEDWGKYARDADRLGVLRSDYMLNPTKTTTTTKEEDETTTATTTAAGSSTSSYELKQVELNTIASSFAGLSVQVSELHRYLTKRFNDRKGLERWLQSNEVAVMGVGRKKESSEEEGSGSSREGVPQNPALTKLPEAMNVAHGLYTDRHHLVGADDDGTSTPSPAVILFIVQEGETNTVDQRMLEFQLWKNHNIPVIRVSLTAAYHNLILDETTGALYYVEVDGDGDEDGDDDDKKTKREVSVVYFRAGYAPTDYVASGKDDEWEARERIERSRATKCPNLGYHLAGTKKVQQELARPGVLERFFPTTTSASSSADDDDNNNKKVESMRGAFAGLYSLGSDATDIDVNAVRAVLLNGMEDKYVLKPQREGGGYNFYGKQLAEKLRDNVVVADDGSGTLTFSKELAEFILMQRLFPPSQRAVLLRGGDVEGTGESISELGIFGTIVSSSSSSSSPGDDSKKRRQIHHSEYSGFLLRTKFQGVDEGGVASGFATLSSPYLC